MDKFTVVASLISLVLQAGLFGLLLKINLQWNTMKERADILWLEYCKTHRIPYRPIGRSFEETKIDG